MKDIEFQFIFPIPPSINKALCTDWKTRRRHYSKAVREYIESVRYLILPPALIINADITLTLIFHFKDRRRRDISNHIKIIEDCLVKNNIIEDDYLIDDLHIHRRKPDKFNPRCLVTVCGYHNEVKKSCKTK